MISGGFKLAIGVTRKFAAKTVGNQVQTSVIELISASTLKMTVIFFLIDAGNRVCKNGIRGGHKAIV